MCPEKIVPDADEIDTHDVNAEQMKSAADDAANLLRAIGSPHRLMILCLLMEKDRTVSEICEAIGARQSLASQHLMRLRLDGIVEATRRGQFAYYSLTDTAAKDIVKTLYRHFCEPANACAVDMEAAGLDG